MDNNKVTKKRGRGRPALPKKHVKGNIKPVRFKDEDLRDFSRAAKASGLSFSEWIRLTCRAAITTNAEPSRADKPRRAISLGRDV